MAEGGHPQVEVAVALVTDPKQRVLLTFNDRWGVFNVPMTKRHRGAGGNEPRPRAALRAGAEALGVPVRLIPKDHRHLPARLLSGRQLTVKDFVYDVYHVEPHPDFADRLQVRGPHLWLSPHLVLSGRYEPISESARLILRGVLDGFEVPVRLQHASVLVVQRDSPERGRQFLLRRDPDWGYALPAKRWEPAGSAGAEDPAVAAQAAAERVAREELGLEPGADVTLRPARRPEYTTHGVSATREAPAYGSETDYHHHLFDAALRHPDTLWSDRPLAWVTEEEIQHGWTAAVDGELGAPTGPAAQVSRTVSEILRHLGLIAEAVDPEIEEMARQAIARIRERRGVARRSEAAVALIRREQDGRTLWLAQWNPKWRAFHLVSGHRRPEESFRECLIREIHEELNLGEGIDYLVAPGGPVRHDFTAWSEGARAETRYTMELFRVELSGDPVRQRLDADPKNRWLSEAEIRSRRCVDGKPISETMEALLSRVGWDRA